MTQKLIQIGTSGGVTIPKSQLEKIGARIGDPVETEMDFANSTFTVRFQNKTSIPIDPMVIEWTNTFISKNRELLERLKYK